MINNKKFKEISLSFLFERACRLEFDSSSYLASYPYMLKFFDGIDVIRLEHLVIGSHMVYGWMPRILNLELGEQQKSIDCLNKVKNGRRLNRDEVLVCKSQINNSYVGLSKLLHFVNPKEYGIWDNHVARYVLIEPKHDSTNSLELFLLYQEFICELAGDERFNPIHELVQSKLGYYISGLRAIELLFFEESRKQAGNNTTRFKS